MKRYLYILAALVLLASCRSTGNINQKRFEISFPEAPVVLFDNAQADKQVINYFNIIQTGDREYRMYYIAVENGIKIEEFAHNLYVAWSEDLVNWHFESPLGGSDLIMKGILEQSVSYTPGAEFPYRLVGNIFEDGRYKLCMWQSRDGIDFVNRKVVLEDRMHDSQCVIIPDKDRLKMYYRQSVKLGPGNYDRKVVLRYLDLEGNPITDMEFITDDYLYNSAASRIDDDFDLLLPTGFNNAPGMGDACRFRAFIQHGFYSQEIECPLNDWITPEEKWFLAAPGLIQRDGKQYIAYNCRNTSHDQGCIDRSCYKLIEIKIGERDDQAALNPKINQSEDGIQTGDLLFVGIPMSYSLNGGMADAIVAATGNDEINYIHAAILEVDDEGQVWVIDATIKHGVHRHPLDTLLKDFTLKDGSQPHYEVMRLPDNRRANTYIAKAKTFIGEEYDQWFLAGNGKHYCTELVEDSYKDFGMPIFKGKPMNFKNNEGEFPTYWKELFALLGEDIPQGQPGTNPQDMHADKRLQLVTTRFTPAPHELCTISNSCVSLSFDATDGRLVSFVDKASGMDMIDPKTAARSSWGLYDANEKPMGDMAGVRFSIRKSSDDSAVLNWDLADGSSVESTIRLEKDRPLSCWTIKAQGFKGLTRVMYPAVGGFKAGENEKLAISSWQGSLRHNPRQERRKFTWSCPGNLNMQLTALYSDNLPGLYMSSNDPRSMSKTYTMEFDDEHTALLFDITLPEVDRDSYSSDFDMIIGLFHGDWHEAAALYRESAREMPWFKESRPGSGKTADWAVNTPVWVWNRGYSDNVLAEAEDFSEYLGMPVSVLWHWWHGSPYDDGFPEYIPPRDGEEKFKQDVAHARAKGINALVYMNSIQWGNATESWDRLGVEKYKVIRRDGSDHSKVYNVFTGHALTPMCMGTDFWKNHYTSLCDTVLNGYGVSGVYMDQACTSMKCYNPDHGHPLGGGNVWVSNFGKLTEMIRQKAAQPVLAGEGSGETWMPYLDLFLTLEASRERYMGIQNVETIPLFQAVYHDRAICFGSYSSLVYPPYDDMWPDEFRPANREKELPEQYNSQFRMEQARGFVWGTQPMISNYHSFLRNTRPLELEYLKRLVQTRMNAMEYLGNGICTRCPQIKSAKDSIDVSRISIYAGRHGNAVTSGRIQTPVLFSEGWKSTDGSYAVALTNISDEDQPVRFTLNPAEYGFKGRYSVNIIDCNGRRPLMKKRRGLLHIDMQIGARDAFLIEIE